MKYDDVVLKQGETFRYTIEFYLSNSNFNSLVIDINELHRVVGLAVQDFLKKTKEQ